MSETRRKLTTIFAADVQGYSRLMEADEEGTHATLRQYRDAMGRLIVSHGGRVINTWGDGVLGEFPSVVEAVRAAIDVQNELAGRNALRPTETRMEFRIGINLGDVIVEGDDIFGDGVNIASRLQASANAGGIVISNTVYDQVRNKVAVGFEFLGQLSVKNIEEAVPSYAVRIGEAERASEPAEMRSQWGRTPAPAGERPLGAARGKLVSNASAGKQIGVLALVAAALIAINLITGGGSFWAAWPLLVLAVLAGLIWVRTFQRVDKRLATLAAIGLGIVGINLLSWSGEFWAVWPLLGISLAGGIGWIVRQDRGGRPRR